MCLDIVEIFDGGNDKLKTEVRNLAHRWLGDVERRLADREWIACADFTVADIMMAGVLRGIRKTDLMRPFPKLAAYYERCFARPAWQRTLGLYAGGESDQGRAPEIHPERELTRLPSDRVAWLSDQRGVSADAIAPRRNAANTSVRGRHGT